ncbi:uncharacterized protein LOC114737888 [Neltuma alba]|uniref:uncharacterized protein LOC114737888 n=1 Tax=Neltuma alba TaxID=207710 RepID=UPI0010A2F3ED|nr:uncharacterized protein LOC114737888 [Prosopis alba]
MRENSRKLCINLFRKMEIGSGVSSILFYLRDMLQQIAKIKHVSMEADWNAKDSRWSIAWKWPGAQRVRTFLWLVLNGRLLTNQERFRRRMPANYHYNLCNGEVENLNHALRTCKLTSSCWHLILPMDNPQQFYLLPFDSWIGEKISKPIRLIQRRKFLLAFSVGSSGLLETILFSAIKQCGLIVWLMKFYLCPGHHSRRARDGHRALELD